MLSKNHFFNEIWNISLGCTRLVHARNLCVYHSSYNVLLKRSERSYSIRKIEQDFVTASHPNYAMDPETMTNKIYYKVVGGEWWLWAAVAEFSSFDVKILTEKQVQIRRQGSRRIKDVIHSMVVGEDTESPSILVFLYMPRTIAIERWVQRQSCGEFHDGHKLS